jgi:branched-chain amino acid transport system substrate-binding protein
MLAVLGIASVLWTLGCGWAGGSDESDDGGGGGPAAKIVSDLPLQGADRTQTETMVNAIELALEQRNHEAGDVKIEYESLDDATAQTGQWDEAKCAHNAESAAREDELVGWIGPFNSGCAQIEIPILNKGGLGMISPSNTYTGLTKPGGESGEPGKYYPTGERNYARVIVADDRQGEAAAVLMQEEGVESVYILDDKETYGTGLAEQVQKTAEDLGIEVLGRASIDPRSSSYPSLMERIAETEPDAIYFGGVIENNAAQVIQDKVGAGMPNDEVDFIGPEGILNDTLVTQAGEAAEGIYVTSARLPESELSAEGQEFAQKYEAEYGEDIQPHTPYAYEAANVMLDAIERAYEADGEVTRENVLREIFATRDYQGVLGTWSFDENGDTTLTKLSVKKVEDGEFELYRTLDISERS